MRYDKRTLVAALLFVALFIWLIILSIQQQTLRGLINQPLKQIQGQLQDLKVAEAKTINIKGTTCSVFQTNSGAQLGCSDGSSAVITDGANGDTLQPSAPLAPLPAIIPKDGTNGKDAPSNYDLWLQGGNNGTVTDYLNTLKGQNGGDGRTPQFRCNPIKLQIEYRYIGDTFIHQLNTLSPGQLCSAGSTTFQ